MSISFSRLDAEGVDRAALVEFMTRNDFPFHVRTRVSAEDVERGIRKGAFRSADNDSYWVEHERLGRIGFLRLEDLTDRAPLVDLRLDGPFRGQGLGVEVLRAATDLVFGTMPDVNRFEGQTREDNIAMLKTFLRCGWVKEAHYREAWPVAGAEPVASVAYGILRRDWQTSTITTFTWGDFAD